MHSEIGCIISTPTCWKINFQQIVHAKYNIFIVFLFTASRIIRALVDRTYPISRCKVHCLGKVVSLVKAGMVRTREGDDELPSMLVGTDNLWKKSNKRITIWSLSKLVIFKITLTFKIHAWKENMNGEDKVIVKYCKLSHVCLNMSHRLLIGK